MEKLKTLKELSDYKLFISDSVSKDILKQEAIKYVKLWLSKIEDKDFKYMIVDGVCRVRNVFEMEPLNQHRVASIGAFVSFFNLTEEDLK